MPNITAYYLYDTPNHGGDLQRFSHMIYAWQTCMCGDIAKGLNNNCLMLRRFCICVFQPIAQIFSDVVVFNFLCTLRPDLKIDSLSSSIKGNFITHYLKKDQPIEKRFEMRLPLIFHWLLNRLILSLRQLVWTFFMLRGYGIAFTVYIYIWASF